MKTNKMTKKLTLTGLMTLAACGVVGSITGTVAWYQYSNTVNTSFSGVTAGTSGSLQIGIGDSEADAVWGVAGDNDNGNLPVSAIKTYLESKEYTSYNTLKPVTAGGNTGAQALSTFKGQPLFGKATLPTVAAKDNYIVLPLWFRFVTNPNTDGDYEFAAKDVFLTDFYLDAQTANTADPLDSAIRVHFSDGANSVLAAKAAGSHATSGKLDLNGDGADDKEATYEFETAGSDIVYNNGSGTQTFVAANSLYPTDDGEGNLTGGTSLGKTTTSGAFKLVVTVWLEGWALIDSDAIWSNDTIGYAFDLGLTFGCTK